LYQPPPQNGLQFHIGKSLLCIRKLGWGFWWEGARGQAVSSKKYVRLGRGKKGLAISPGWSHWKFYACSCEKGGRARRQLGFLIQTHIPASVLEASVILSEHP
jgi:hypothetical protein